MALGSKSGYGNTPLIFLSPRTKDAEGNKVRPHFIVDRKDPATGEFIRDGQTVTEVSGDLFKVEFKQREFEGNLNKEIVLYLRDNSAGEGGESYRLAVRFGVSGRGLINRLATLIATGDFSNLTIDYYENKKGYDAYGLSQNGQRVEWKYSLDQQPKPEPVMHKGKLVKNDYSELDSFYEAEVLALAAILAPKGQTTTAAPAPAQPASAQKQTARRAPQPAPTAEGQPADQGDENAVEAASADAGIPDDAAVTGGQQDEAPPAPAPVVARATAVPRNTNPPPRAAARPAANPAPRPAAVATPARTPVVTRQPAVRTAAAPAATTAVATKTAAPATAGARRPPPF